MEMRELFSSKLVPIELKIKFKILNSKVNMFNFTGEII